MKSREVKKRCFRACVPCRARKVRCIVTERFQPCMNCKLDEKDCDFARGAKIYPKHPRRQVSGSKTPDTRSERSSQEIPPLSNQPSLPATLAAPDTDTPHHQFSNHDESTQESHSSSVFSSHFSSENPKHLYDPTEPRYSFLQVPKVKTILPQDLDFLYKQGCFVIPERHVLDEFIQKYFLFIHPILPLINEADFWAMYNSKTLPDRSYDRISILVLQGMLFTSSTFISEETFQSLGFKTTQDAKYTFYRRAKLLYDFGYERCSIAIAQAAVLLSHSHLIPLPYGGYKQLGSLWAGIAIHHARDARAHRYAFLRPDSTLSPEQKRQHNVLKRLWWCCIICDRVIPLTSRQTIKITRSNFNFDQSPILSVEDLSDEFDHSDVYDSSTKAFLAQALIKTVELCVILTDVLSLSNLVHENPFLSLLQNSPEEKPAVGCRVRLQRWHNSFLEWKCTIRRKAIKDVSQRSSGSLVLFANLAEMYYHSARLTLCHYEMLHLGHATSSPLAPTFDIVEMVQKSYELQNAIAQITECLSELTRLGLIRWLPMSAVGCTAFPLALQILDVELRQLRLSSFSPLEGSSSSSSRYRQERLNVLLEAMKIYRPRYFIVDWINQTIRHIVDVAQKFLPSTETVVGDARLSIASWIEILQMQPNCYLRLALTMDLSISNGKLPDETDFPPPLRHMLQGYLSVLPGTLPFSLSTPSGSELLAVDSSCSNLPQGMASEDTHESPPLTKESCDRSSPRTENNFSAEDDKMNGLDQELGRTLNGQDMASSVQLSTSDSPWGSLDSEEIMDESIELMSSIEFQSLDFNLESITLCQDVLMPFANYQWDDGNANNTELGIDRLDGAGFDIIQDFSKQSIGKSDQLVLGEMC
ncbi:hypothetical protein BGZ63DRAFT_478779 [Mariannaea sp. PMI_226]|nr:hypothetical protein BGZ63DRAFT_478779 [Mariannaea sp. PMI_226]